VHRLWRGARLWTATRRKVGSSRRRSPASEVRTASPRWRAQRTTEASTTSAVFLTPQSRPAARAPASSSGCTVTAAAASRRSRRAWRRPSRHACPTTPAGTTMGTPSWIASSRGRRRDGRFGRTRRPGISSRGSLVLAARRIQGTATRGEPTSHRAPWRNDAQRERNCLPVRARGRRRQLEISSWMLRASSKGKEEASKPTWPRCLLVFATGHERAIFSSSAFMRVDDCGPAQHAPTTSNISFATSEWRSGISHSPPTPE
jgi:hypothetical protein